MKFVLAYKDIAGATGVLSFDAEDINSALVGLKERVIEQTEWAEDITHKNGYPLVLVDESMVGYVLAENDGGVMGIAEAEELSKEATLD
ncbi:hypothetical protein N9L28_05805 [Luminiphilus sp.]|nr:hypothetical protein [Luminiphilus sp.]